MRNTNHWTPRYLRDRVAEIIYQRSSPLDPWLTQNANLALATLIRPTDVGLEFGSGRSTVWLAARMKYLTSVEHNKDWHARVSQMLKQSGVCNVDYQYREAGTDDSATSDHQYAAVAAGFPDNLRFHVQTQRLI